MHTAGSATSSPVLRGHGAEEYVGCQHFDGVSSSVGNHDIATNEIAYVVCLVWARFGVASFRCCATCFGNCATFLVKTSHVTQKNVAHFTFTLLRTVLPNSAGNRFCGSVMHTINCSYLFRAMKISFEPPTAPLTEISLKTCSRKIDLNKSVQFFCQPVWHMTGQILHALAF